MGSYELLPKLSPYGYAAEEPEMKQKRSGRSWGCYGILLFVLSNLFSLSWSYWLLHRQPPSHVARTSPIDVIYRKFWWNTAYSPPNRSDADYLWEEIRPAHGIVSVDKDWADAQNWPPSAYYPDDHTKAVYLLEAYHLLHCLRIMRKTLWEAVDGKPFTYHPGPHVDHCFDALRQSVQCNADDTPLYSFGDHTAGNGQLHQCRDWEQLRVWAAEHSACYRDSIEDITLRDHFGFCTDGDDGLKPIDYEAIIT